MALPLKSFQRRRHMLLVAFYAVADELCENQRGNFLMTLQVFLYTDFDNPFDIFKLFSYSAGKYGRVKTNTSVFTDQQLIIVRKV